MIMKTKTPAVIHSPVDGAPILLSSAAAASGASGVCLISGSTILRRIRGKIANAEIAGTTAASTHDVNPISTPDSRARAAPVGFTAMAVNHRAEDTVRLAIPMIIR